MLCYVDLKASFLLTVDLDIINISLKSSRDLEKNSLEVGHRDKKVIL